MATTITNVTELQAMENDLTEDYVLGNNIDASATSGWNGGGGFDPIGIPVATHHSYVYPASDLVIGGDYIGTYPDDGDYWDKVDDPQDSPDDDATYNHQTGGDVATFVYGSSSSVPNDAYDITVRLYSRAKTSGTNRYYGLLRVGGANYLTATYYSPPSSYTGTSWEYPVNPSTSLDWTVSDIVSIQGFGWYSNYGNSQLNMTQVYLRISYKLDHRFTGTFNGAGYTISDLYIDRPSEDNVGLFGCADGVTIKDVELEDVDITGVDYVGVLGGYSSDSTISGCAVRGTVNGRHYMGGLAGWTYSSTISKCYTTGSVTGTNFIGGLIGAFQTCTMSDCYTRASVTGDTYVAGLAAYAWMGETITNCYSTGAVTGSNLLGGLLGYSEGTITNCFWDTTTSGQATSDGGTGYPTATMKLLVTFYPLWDIDQTTTDRNDSYPFLSWEIDESDTIWLIYGTGVRSFTIPDILDHKGRPVKNARVQAFRVDTHTFVEEELTDEYGSATFDELPNDVDVVFTPTWGGTRTPRL